MELVTFMKMVSCSHCFICQRCISLPSCRFYGVGHLHEDGVHAVIVSFVRGVSVCSHVGFMELVTFMKMVSCSHCFICQRCISLPSCRFPGVGHLHEDGVMQSLFHLSEVHQSAIT